MLPPAWQTNLTQSLSRLAERPTAPRVAVVGMGQALRGDDAAGGAIARGLQTRLPGPGNVLVLDAGAAPENITGALRRHAPALVVLVDAAELGEAPGMLRWLAWEDTRGLTASTHTLPPHLLALYLTTMLGCEVALLGVQPGSTALDAPLSPAVAQAVEAASAGLAAALTPFHQSQAQAATPTTG